MVEDHPRRRPDAAVKVRFVARIAIVPLCLALCTATLGMSADAQEYPNRPITLIVPFAPGGSASVMARLAADKMSETLGQQVVIDNRAGAGSTIGARLAAKAAPDGYTILLSTNATLGIAPNLQANVGYDARKDFAPIGLIGSVPSVLMVLPGYPARTFGELIKLGKDTGASIDFGSPGIGTVNHLAGERIGIMTGVKLRHVPYRGAALALNDLLGGHIPLLISALPNVHSHIEAGTLRALALTSARRSSLVPQVPSIAESGLSDFDMTLTYGMASPAGTPRPIVERLNKALNAALASEEVKRQLAREGTEPMPTTPDDYAAIIDRDEAKWSALIKAIGLKPQ